jgi:bud site selection protein 31
MPKVRTKRTNVPEGWDKIEPVMLELDAKMRDCAYREARIGVVLWRVRRARPSREFCSSATLCTRADEAAPHEGKRVLEASWPIFRVHHQRSRYVYEMYRKHEISRELYEWCCREGYADANLIAKWKKQGYERLCCLRCIQTKEHNYGTTCICRVP